MVNRTLFNIMCFFPKSIHATTINLDSCRFISKVYKSKKRIITADQQLIEDTEDDPIPKITFPKSRKGISFLNYFEGKSIERVDDKDERFANTLINARNLSGNNNLIVVEGINTIRDAIKMNASLVSLFFTQRELMKSIPYTGLATNAKVFYVTYENMRKFSILKTPPGIMAVFKRPNPESMLSDVTLSKKLPLTLILDKIKDPGNLGTIIRTAAGFNVNKILMTAGCADLYSEKVMRGSMASMFCVPVFEKLSWSTVANSLSENCSVYYAGNCAPTTDNDSFTYDNRHLIDFSNGKNYGLVIGDQSRQMSPEATHLCETRYGCQITVPMINDVSGHNAPIIASIIMAQFQKVFLVDQ